MKIWHIIDKGIMNRFGSRRGFLRSAYFYILSFLGFYRIDKSEEKLRDIKRLVFVCSGNLCRSAIANARARSFGFNADSFGINTRGGDFADPRAAAYAERTGISLSEHKTKSIEHFKMRSGDALVLVEPAHYSKLKDYKDTFPIIYLGMYRQSQNPYIHDPYSANNIYFDRCCGDVDKSVEALVSQIRKANNG